CQSLPTSRTRPCASRRMAAATTNSRRATVPRQRASFGAHRHARQGAGLLLGLERGRQLVQVAGQHAGEVVRGVPDAVVGDARLREVVGADALAPLAGADLDEPRLPRLVLGAQ